MKRKIILLIFMSLFFSSVFQVTYAVPTVDSSEKVYDFAELFTPEEENKLYNYINDFIDKYEIDMAIVTTEENDKGVAETYADDFYDYNGFGIGPTYDGLLLLIDMDTRTMHISTTGQAILIYDDYRIESMLDNAYYHISNQDYYKTAYNFIIDSENYIKMGIPSSNEGYEIDINGDYVRKKGAFPFFGFLIASLIISGIFILIAKSRHKVVKKATEAKNYLIRGSLSLTQSSDRFVNSHTSTIYVPKTSSSGGSGGSSTHRGSSGRSHGGGSRRF